MNDNSQIPLGPPDLRLEDLIPCSCGPNDFDSETGNCQCFPIFPSSLLEEDSSSESDIDDSASSFYSDSEAEDSSTEEEVWSSSDSEDDSNWLHPDRLRQMSMEVEESLERRLHSEPSSNSDMSTTTPV